MSHPQPLTSPVACAVITVSDTRTFDSDRSGQLIQALLHQAGHQISDYRIVPDEPLSIGPLCQGLGAQSDVDVIILTGGTGIAPRDTTYDVVATLLDKTLPGFGEIFRQLSFQEIGSRAMASRAVAGVYGSTLVFSLPGSSKAVQLAMEALILPELPHLVSLLRS
ncbi:MogA/MoaB family molybdenum cofactor biosynthesis protein [Nodosilinea sp. P-1105]|uniref:MogA/MoaB family molybdenum cofactor biosynthesis protein n=1 Tax=Nodosilinea sp. P-1105 TaxID=2546229 RepID=UPI00146D5DAE|nr:MogA/MoaB family molybdenum cofactor biosynthesis protein [Nodosilinea sp. P-1105]NMF84231.1 MogA/MoaB family molybdenum cofactor biosynthesis protein [Nodosilinea sp. P-1105]